MVDAYHWPPISFTWNALSRRVNDVDLSSAEGYGPGCSEVGATISGGRRYKAMMRYKGYTGLVEFDDGAYILHGEVIGGKWGQCPIGIKNDAATS